MCISKMYCLILSVMLVSAAVVGCNRSPSKSNDDAGGAQATDSSNEVDDEISSALAKLPEEERVAAAAQKFCAVEQENMLGTMGTPFKLLIEGQPVFLCCEGCKDKALEDPQATLAVVTKLKQSHSSGQ
jgi:hypothetical protein